MMVKYATVDEYIASFPKETQALLEKIRATIRKAVPTETTEKISYGIPTFVYHGNLIHFAGYTTHLGLYPGGRAIAAFADQLKEYETSKGTIRLSLDKPLPLDLITRLTKYCVASRSKSFQNKN